MGLAKHINDLPGNGLIYTGTRVETENYSRWLLYVGVQAVGYNAGLDAETRKEIEQGLMQNRWKCVVSTNALGMGIDNPDIHFIIHTQIPASPIHYYQEIGRAGRDSLPTYVVLFYNSLIGNDGIQENCHLPKASIDGAKPTADKYQAVIDILKEELLDSALRQYIPKKRTSTTIQNNKLKISKDRSMKDQEKNLTLQRQKESSSATSRKCRTLYLTLPSIVQKAKSG